MAFFKFRKGGDDHPTPSPAPESVEAMRKRARHRLIGAAVLVLAGVIGFPLLFDNQPRPIAVDIPIEIPDKSKAKPLGNVSVSPPSAQSAGVVDTTAVVAQAPAIAASDPAKVSAPEAPKVVPKPADKESEKPAPKPAAGVGRYVVQVGAFADVLKAREARAKLEKAGLKTYTQVVQVNDAKRIRVRVGPFETKSEADKVAEKIKKLDLPAAILEL
jgi:DedD protein